MAEIMITKYYAKYDFDGFPCNQDHDYIEITYEDENEHEIIAFDVDDVNSDFNVKRHTEKFLKMLKNFKEKHGLELINKPLEEKEYIVEENGTKGGKDLIKDSRGYNYSYWRETKNENKTKYFRCIKRHKQGTSDCKSYLKVINYKEENMEVKKTNDHNHEPQLELNIKRKMKNDLKRQCIENPSEKPSKVIENVLDSNEEYKKLYEIGSSPKMKSMYTFLNRHRKSKKPKSFDELLQEEIDKFPECLPTGESQDHNSNENISSINIKLL